MKALRALVLKYPVISSLAVLLLASVLTEIPLSGLFDNTLGHQASFYLTLGLEQFIVALLGGLLLVGLGLLKKAGLTKPTPLKSLWIVWPILVLAILNGSGLFDGSLQLDFSRPLVLVLFVFIALSTGFVEEIVCRGFVVTVLLEKLGRTKKGVYQAALLSSVLFGLLHFQNFLVGRGSLLQVSTQVVYAVFFGVFFAACFLRFQSLWPSIITHALFDMMGTVNEVAVGNSFDPGMSGNMTVEGALISLAFTLPLFVAGLILLRKVPQRTGMADRA
jgi:membrane protease YdiL (CAAX protease family)